MWCFGVSPSHPQEEDTLFIWEGDICSSKALVPTGTRTVFTTSGSEASHVSPVAPGKPALRGDLPRFEFMIDSVFSHPAFEVADLFLHSLHFGGVRVRRIQQDVELV